jgi:hypothetical protein
MSANLCRCGTYPKLRSFVTTTVDDGEDNEGIADAVLDTVDQRVPRHAWWRPSSKHSVDTQ